MNKLITFFRIGVYKVKILGFILLVLSIIFLLIQRFEIVSLLPRWLLNWLIVLSLTLISFSKEKTETNKIELFRLQALYLSSMTVLSLIIALSFVYEVFHLNEHIEPIVIAFIFNIIFLVTYYIQKIIGKKVNGIENSSFVSFNMTIRTYIIWGIISALALSLIFVLF